jgi:hypothetical protein
MLDFYTIRDDQATSARDLQLHLIGSIEEEEFEAAVAAGVIERHLDYYGKFRWSSELVNRKLTLLEKLGSSQLEELLSILKQAKAAESGIIAQGD